jgi:hypothetical protein
MSEQKHASSEESVLSWLRGQGYPLELRIGNVLRRRGWHVEHADWYLDPVSNALREIDIRASLYGNSTDDDQSAGGG